MDPIRVRTKLESDTLTLSELRPLIGKEVEIVVTERPGPAVVADRWAAAAAAVRELADYDFAAAAEQRAFDAAHADDHVR